MIYLASPYTHKEEAIMKAREIEITLIAARLTKMYKIPMFLPITQSARMAQLCPSLFGHTFDAWKDIDLMAINHCDEVWVITMPGWKESVGVQAEIAYAKSINKKVLYLDPDTLEVIE